MARNNQAVARINDWQVKYQMEAYRSGLSTVEAQTHVEEVLFF